MPEISSLTRQKPVDALLDLGDGESVRITFDANRVTPAWVNDVERRLNDRDVLSVPKALAEAIISWDVTDDGQPWPASADNLAVFSFPAMSVFFEAIMEAAVPGVAGKRIVAICQRAAFGNLTADVSELPEWLGYFDIADALGCSPVELEDLPVYWLRRAQIKLEVDAGVARAQAARNN